MGTRMVLPGLKGLMRKQDRFRYPEFQPIREKNGIFVRESFPLLRGEF